MKREQAKLVFLLPAVLWVLVFTVFPLAYSAGVSFAKQDSRVEVSHTIQRLITRFLDLVFSVEGNAPVLPTSPG